MGREDRAVGRARDCAFVWGEQSFALSKRPRGTMLPRESCNTLRICGGAPRRVIALTRSVPPHPPPVLGAPPSASRIRRSSTGRSSNNSNSSSWPCKIRFFSWLPLAAGLMGNVHAWSRVGVCARALRSRGLDDAPHALTSNPAPPSDADGRFVATELRATGLGAASAASAASAGSPWRGRPVVRTVWTAGRSLRQPRQPVRHATTGSSTASSRLFHDEVDCLCGGTEQQVEGYFSLVQHDGELPCTTSSVVKRCLASRMPTTNGKPSTAR